MGKTHCPTCLRLDQCWFAKSNMPQLPQHPYCHCTAVPITNSRVNASAKAFSPHEKFANYLFEVNHPQNRGKAKLFQLWGYNADDSEWMVTESERQAREKYIAGEYTLGDLDEFGQRINIQITSPNRIKGGTITFRTGWIARQNGEIRLVTPYGDKQ